MLSADIKNIYLFELLSHRTSTFSKSTLEKGLTFVESSH